MRFVVPTETPAPSRLAWCVEGSPSLRPEYVSSRYDSSLPSPTSTVRRVASPSPSNGREPSAPGSRPSSTMVTVGAATRVPRRSSRNEARRYRLGPLAAPAIERSRLAAMSGSKITGTSVVFTLRAPSRRSARAPVEILRALGVGDARVGRKRRRLRAPRQLDLLLGGRLRALVVLQLEVGDAVDQLAVVGQAGVRILGGDARERGRLVHHALERVAREIRGRRGGRGAAGEHAKRQPLLARMGDRVHLPQAHGGAERPLFDQEAVGGGGAARAGALQDIDEQRGVDLAHRPTAVPPTVISSIKIVGSPTPTGTDWPSLPQVPTPSSRARS